MAKIYLAGPMRGYKDYNFPLFDEVKEQLEDLGHQVESPADIDRSAGFDPKNLSANHDWNGIEGSGLNLKSIVAADLEALQDCDCICLLPGWRQSIGAKAEKAAAEWLELDVYYAFKGRSDLWILHERDPAEPQKHLDAAPLIYQDAEDILEEALRITKGDRQASYGPPDQDFTRTAAMWSAWKGVEFTAKEVAAFMIMLKLSREKHQKKRDNWVDVAGYARCGSLCSQ